MILITGAGGKTGNALIEVLSRVESVCAFVYRDEYVSIAESLGAEKIVVGDLRDETRIRFAMQDVRAVYHICVNMSPDEVEIGRFVILEGRRAGVEHLVYHSVLHPQTEKMTHHWHKMRVEEMLFESGIPFTILQPAPYMQNLLANWKSLTEKGVLRVPYSVHSKFSFIDLDDIAEAARVVLTEIGHKNAVYELAGTLPLTHADVAEIFSRILNKSVRAEREAIEEWMSRTKQMSEYALENLIRMFEYYDQWGLAGNPIVLQWVLKREPTSLETFIQRILREQNATN